MQKRLTEVASGIFLLAVTVMRCMATEVSENRASVTINNVSLTVSVPKEVRPGDDGMMSIVLNNGSDRTFNYYWTSMHVFFMPQVFIAGSQTMLPLTRYGQRRVKGPLAKESSGLQAFRSLQPGGNLSVEMSITRLYDMTLEDDYAVSVRCKGRLEDVADPIEISVTNVIMRVLSSK